MNLLQADRTALCEAAERDLTVGEALDAGFTVGEWCCGDEVVRAYGLDEAEAETRLRNYLLQYAVTRYPSPDAEERLAAYYDRWAASR